MQPDKYKIEDLLKDPSFTTWVEGKRTPDTLFWEQWVKGNPQCAAVVNEAKAIIKGIQFSPKALPEEQIHQALVRLNEELDRKNQAKTISIFKHKKFLRLTATCLAALFVAGSILTWLGQPQATIHQTAFGEKLELNLQDGTEVSLNANSRLKYFPNQPREVWIEGEAYFEVAKKEKTGEHFLVHTKDLTVEVLGTEFNVHSRQEKTRVMLEEGKVNLQFENGEEKEMLPGDLISYSAKLNQIIKEEKEVKSAIHTSWKDGSLLFEDVSVDFAMQRIAEIYGFTILYQDEEVSTKRIHIGIPTSNLDLCIKAMEIACGIKIEKTDQQLKISKAHDQK